jgi:hypothetical protein
MTTAGSNHHTPAAHLRRREGLVEITGVGELGWGQGRDCTFAGALSAALAATDRPASYEQIMGATGLAFRLRWYRGREGLKHCPSSPVGEFPEEIAAAQRATGWTIRTHVHLDEPGHDMTAYREEVLASIHAGRPVCAYDRQLNLGVIYGHDEPNDQPLMTTYEHPGGRAISWEQVGPMLLLLAGPAAVPAPREQALEAVRIAVSNWRRQPITAMRGAYLFGREAYDAWRDDIDRADELAEADRANLHFVNWWCFSSLLDARKAGSLWLAGLAESMAPQARSHVLAAAKLYGRQVSQLATALEDKDAFHGPWSGLDIGAWTSKVRRRERDILEASRNLDAQAIEHLAAVCRVEGVLPDGKQTLSVPSGGAGGRAEPGEPADQREHRADAVLDAFDRVGQQANDLCQRSETMMLRVLLEAAGRPVSYEWLLAASGWSGQFLYHPKQAWVTFVPPVDTIAEAGRALGVRFERVEAGSPQAARDRIRSAVDAGQGLMAHYYEEMIFCGYREAGDNDAGDVLAVCIPFMMQGRWLDDEAFANEWWDRPWGGELIRYAGPADAMDRRTLLVRRMSDLVRLAEQSPLQAQHVSTWPEGVAGGLAALERYAADLEWVEVTMQSPDEEPEADLDRGWGCYAVYPQWTARACTARFLRDEARHLPGPARRRALEAAHEYESAVAQWRQWEKHLGRRCEPGPGATKEEAYDRHWANAEQRKLGSACVRQAIAHERDAIQAIKAALAELKL